MIQKIAAAAEALESLRRAKGKGARTQPNKTNDKPGLSGTVGGAGAGVIPLRTSQIV